jgi:hypothetical protein
LLNNGQYVRILKEANVAHLKVANQHLPLQLASWKTVHLEKPTEARLVNALSTSYGTRKIIAVFMTSPRDLVLSKINSVNILTE